MKKNTTSQGYKMYKIIDNFLNENELKTILKAINNNNFSWFLIEKRFLDRYKNKDAKKILAAC